MQSPQISSAPTDAVGVTRAGINSQIIGCPLSLPQTSNSGHPHKYISPLNNKGTSLQIASSQQINGQAPLMRQSVHTSQAQTNLINHMINTNQSTSTPSNSIDQHHTEVLLSPLPGPSLSDTTSNTTPVSSSGEGDIGYTCGLVCSKVFKTTDELTKHFLQDHVENYTNALKGTNPGTSTEQDTKPIKLSGNTLMSNLLAMASGHQIKPVNTDSKRLSGKTYDCDVCNKKFGRLADLSRHLLVHSGVKPYRCNMCEKAYRNSGDLKTHMNMHAGIRPYGCAVCQRSFTARGVLARHMRTHTGERPYSCFVCAKAFADRRSRHDHLLTHTGEKPHQCSICGKNFLQSSTLRTHVKTQHAAITGLVKQDVHEAAMGALKPDLHDHELTAIKNEMLSPGIQSPNIQAVSLQSPTLQSAAIQSSKHQPLMHSQSLDMSAGQMTQSNAGPQHTIPVTV